MNHCPCNGCTERWVEGVKTCHSSCEKYPKWKKERDKNRQKEQLNSILNSNPRSGYWQKRDGYWKNPKIQRRRK